MLDHGENLRVDTNVSTPISIQFSHTEVMLSGGNKAAYRTNTAIPDHGQYYQVNRNDSKMSHHLENTLREAPSIYNCETSP
ncbi:MAG: hypothetical protein FD165_1926 [Gammaproteobacteria bacterium]|nr:MAG: hypothetical protein FD165_1926 [Gammaproteobacteria bacterium]TND04498.1 MAG: hypothetical protein FD120_1612 [Gammaproteobacteria bacterium]